MTITQQQAIEALERVYYATHASFIDRNLVRQYIEQSTAQPQAVVPAPGDYEAHQKNGLAWAVNCWNQEVKNRPLINVHRRTLDDTWRQVIRYFGGEPYELIGPSHDALINPPKGA